MTAAKTLLDSNVVVAAMAEHHVHHEPSRALLDQLITRGKPVIAAHSFAESFTTLTRRGASAPLQWSAPEALAALETIAAVTTLIGLTPTQTVDAVRRFAQRGGIGARLYDFLIGQVAVQHGIRRLVTWNTGHLRDLFPNLEILDPAEALAV